MNLIRCPPQECTCLARPLPALSHIEGNEILDSTDAAAKSLIFLLHNSMEREISALLGIVLMNALDHRQLFCHVKADVIVGLRCATVHKFVNRKIKLSHKFLLLNAAHMISRSPIWVSRLHKPRDRRTACPRQSRSRIAGTFIFRKIQSTPHR